MNPGPHFLLFSELKYLYKCIIEADQH